MAQRVLQVCLAVAASALAVALIVVLAAGPAAQNGRETLAAMAGVLRREDPALLAQAMEQLKEPDPALLEQGRAELARYGYNDNLFYGWARPAVLVAVGGVVLVLLAAYLLLNLWDARRRKKRLDAMTALLASAEAGRETLAPQAVFDEFRYLEDAIGKTVSALRQGRETALAERQRLAENLADIAHQIKTPITSISLMTQLLAEDANGSAAEYLDKLNRQTGRLEALVSALLTLSRLDAGAVEMAAARVEAGPMLLAAMEPVEMQLRQRGQQVALLDPDGAWYTGDFGWSAEAFLNLIKNCSEHTPPGGHITLRCQSNPLYTEIVVEDDGPGFAPEELPRLFHRFYRGQSSKDGLGIGLSMARAIIEGQGGLLAAASWQQGGARFTAKFYQK